MLKALRILVWINAALSIAVLLFYMIVFGALTGSVKAGLIFPSALPSMVLEGDLVATWICASLALLAVVQTARLLLKRRRIAALSAPSDG